MPREIQILLESSSGLKQAGSEMVNCSEELSRDIEVTDMDGVEFAKSTEFTKTAGGQCVQLGEILSDVIDEVNVSYNQENVIEESKGLVA